MAITVAQTAKYCTEVNKAHQFEQKSPQCCLKNPTKIHSKTPHNLLLGPTVYSYAPVFQDPHGSLIQHQDKARQFPFSDDGSTRF